MAPAADLAGWKTTGGSWEWKGGSILPANGNSEIVGDHRRSELDRLYDPSPRPQAGRAAKASSCSSTRKTATTTAGGMSEAGATRWHAAKPPNNGDRDAYGPGVPFVVETGRWYDLRLEVTGNHVRGFVDGKLVTDTNDSVAAPLRIASSPTRRHHTVLSRSSTRRRSVDMAITCESVSRSEGHSHRSCGDPTREYVEQPTNIAPKQERSQTPRVVPSNFPPHSLTCCG